MPITITPSQALDLTTDTDNDGVADPGETVKTTILVTNVGSDDVLALTIADTLNGLSLVPGTLKVTPIAFDDAFTITGNTPITFATSQLTGNDIDPDGSRASLTITGVNGATGGTVSLSNGAVTFVPTTGFNGTASFQYTVTDAQGLSSVSTGAVTLTVTDKVWYVDSAYGGANGASDGSYLRPFTSLAPLNTSASDPDGTGDTIFVYDRGTAYTGGIVLEAGQSLIGSGVAFSRNGMTIGGGLNTTLNTATVGIELSTGNTVRGITVNTTAAGAVGIQDGNGTVGTLTISNTSVTGTGKAVDIDQGGTLAVQFDTLSSTGSATEGVHLQGLGGTFAATTGAISNAANQGVLIGQAGGALANSGGTVAVSYGGNLFNNGATAAGIEIQDHATGAITFSGPIDDTTGPGIVVDTNTGALSFNGVVNISSGGANGISLTNAGTVSFAGGGSGVSITTTSGTGLIFSGGGSLAIAGASNSISTATGSLATLSGTVAAGGIQFASLTTSGTVTGNGLTATNLDGGSLSIGSLTVAGATGDGINVTTDSSSNITIGSVAINAVAGDGIEINGSTGSFTVTGGSIGNTNDPAGDGVNVTGGTGAVTIGANITKTTAGNVVEVNNHDGGAVVFSGNLSATGGSANGILVTNTNAGSVTFSGGTKTLTTGTNAAVDLSNNSGATVAFTGGGLAITTTTATGFSATGGGTVGVSGAGNTVSTTTGTAVNVSATTSSGLTWQSINTTNADVGINLQNTGAGAFTVTGVAGSANSGGTIAGATTGINLLNTGTLDLTQVRIVGDTTSDDGIYGQNVGGLALTNVTISGNPGSGQTTDRGVEIVNLTGTATVTNSTFSNMPGHLFNVKNATGTLNLTITGSTFSGSQVSGVGGDDGILIENDGTSVINARITNSTFFNNEGDHIQWAGDGGAATGQLTISNNSFSMPSPGDGLGGGITISPSGSANLVFAVTNNVINGNISGAAVDVTTINGNAGAVVQGTVSGNQIGTAGIANSGSAQGYGISVENNGNATLTAVVSNNTVNQVAGAFGIEIAARGGTGGGVLNATVSGNTVATPGQFMTSAIRVTGGTSLGTDIGTMNLDILNNNVDTTLANDIRITSNGDVNMFFAGLGGGTVAGGSNASAIKTYLEARNPGNETASVFYNTNNNTAVWGSVTFVAQPTTPAAPLIALPEATSQTSAPVAPDGSAADIATASVSTAPSSSTNDTPAAEITSAAPAHPVIVDDGILTQAELDYLVDAAIARWAAAGASETQLAAMRAATVTLGDMTGPYLGVSNGTRIAINSDGAGYGWYLDTTPGDDAEFAGSGTRLVATGDAIGKIDLLTTLMHELGHQIGIGDAYAIDAADALMYGYIVTGERRTPSALDLAGAGAAPVGQSSFAIAPVSVGTLPAGKAVQISFDATVNPLTPGVVVPISNTTTVSGSNLASVTATRTLTVDTLTLGNLVFLDTNGNGRFDAGETGISNVALSLFVDSNGNGVLDGAEATTVIATTTTGAGGLYQFANLAPGNYAVRVDATNFSTGAVLGGRVSSAGGTGPDDDVDGDDNGVAGGGGAIISNLITLSLNGEPGVDLSGKNDVNTTLDFGFVTPNAAPTATGLAGDTITFVEDGAAVRLDAGANAVVSDTSANFAGGTLRIAVSANKVASEDVLGIATTAAVTTTATTVSVNGTVIGSYVGGGAGGADLVFTLVAAATPATVSELLRALTYRNANGVNPSTATRTISYTLVDGGGTQGGVGADTLQLTSTVAVTGVDDTPTAVADTATTDERTATTVNVVANDIDLDGGQKAVVAINGAAIIAGQTVTLTNSKATVTLNADGSLTYNPNGQFDWLVSSAKAATNPTYYASSATETFTYALNGGSSQTVTMTITGVDTAGDQLRGSVAADTITGTDAADLINLSAGGSDTAAGGLGNDGFYMGGALDAGDRIDGGAGTLDQVGLQGNYTTQLVLGSDTIKNVEMFVFLPGNDTRFGLIGGGLSSYNIKVNDAMVAAGQQFVVQANTLRAGETMIFDGSSETDGSFLTFGGLGTDILTGGAQNDSFYFGQDRFNATDRVDGGAGAMDQLGLQGDYDGAKAIVFGATQLTNIEMIVLLSGADTRFGNGALRFGYTLTMDDANAVGTGPMTIQANTLRSDEVLILDASRETSTPYVVYGGAAADTITGGGGADEIWGRGGGDTLRGGAGNDVFAYFAASDSFGTGSDRDVILDFARGDRIDVSRMGISAFVSGNFANNGTGQIRATGAGSSWVIEGDVNGDGVVDLSIAVTTSAGFTWNAGDFRLATVPITDAPMFVMDSHAFTL